MLGSIQNSMTVMTEINYLIPDYYSKFTCIADRCPITCCQEWKIGVDADTNRKWKKLQAPETVPEQKKNLSAYTIKKDGQRVIGLDALLLLMATKSYQKRVLHFHERSIAFRHITRKC